MNKQELKNLIKPLIKECLKEVLIEEGFTKMVSESRHAVTETMPVKKQPPQQKANLSEARKKMLDSIGNTGFDPFSGSTPITEAGDVSESSFPVTGLNSSDRGVDISRLMSNKLKLTNNAINGKKAKE